MSCAPKLADLGSTRKESGSSYWQSGARMMNLFEPLGLRLYNLQIDLYDLGYTVTVVLRVLHLFELSM